LLTSLLALFSAANESLLTSLSVAHCRLLDLTTDLSSLTTRLSHASTHISILQHNLSDLSLELAQQTELTDRVARERDELRGELEAS
jgi:chromosome segregation ATPase